MIAVAHYLAAKPDGAVLGLLIVAVVLFCVAGVLAAIDKAPYAILISAGLVAVALAFLV